MAGSQSTIESALKESPSQASLDISLKLHFLARFRSIHTFNKNNRAPPRRPPRRLPRVASPARATADRPLSLLRKSTTANTSRSAPRRVRHAPAPSSLPTTLHLYFPTRKWTMLRNLSFPRPPSACSIPLGWSGAGAWHVRAARNAITNTSSTKQLFFNLCTLIALNYLNKYL